jgi:matrixin
VPRPTIIARGLVLASLALAPLLATTTGAGMHSAFAAADASPAAAETDFQPVDHPENVFTIGSSAEQLAIQIAKSTWSTDPCGGQVTVSWGALGTDVNAQSSWTNPQSAYDAPQLNGDCSVTFNPSADFDWAKFCTVMVHEYGHLAGKPHSPDPNDVMNAYYTVPIQTCVNATPADFQPAPPAAPAKQATAAVRTKAKAKTVRKAKKTTATKHRQTAKKHHRSTKRKRAVKRSSR